jgi:hypothetical protein
VYDSFKSQSRKLIADIPIIAFGIGSAIGMFILFLLISEKVKGNLIFEILLGSINGACMNILSAVYKEVCYRGV